MELYHGSNVEVVRPKLLGTRKAMDFGNGFYLTSDLRQASRWATLKTERAGKGSPLVSVFDFDEAHSGRLSVLTYEKPDLTWLAYVTANRKDRYVFDDWDLVVGPVADDQTMPTIGLYLRGYITAEVAIEMLLPQRLKDQYCFKTQAALDYLTHKETINV